MTEIKWYKRDEHPSTFEDGNGYIIALPVRYRVSINPNVYKYGWEIFLVTVRCDEDYFAIETLDGEVWDWEWEDVEYWTPLKPIRDLLPEPSTMFGV